VAYFFGHPVYSYCIDVFLMFFHVCTLHRAAFWRNKRNEWPTRIRATVRSLLAGFCRSRCGSGAIGWAAVAVRVVVRADGLQLMRHLEHASHMFTRQSCLTYTLATGHFTVQSAGGGNFPTSPSIYSTSPLVTANALPVFCPFQLSSPPLWLLRNTVKHELLDKIYSLKIYYSLTYLLT